MPENKIPSIILVPGRIFGALNFAEHLSSSVIEADTVPMLHVTMVKA